MNRGDCGLRLRALWGRNTVTIEMLRANLRDLRTEAGEHYADILLNLYQRQLKPIFYSWPPILAF